MPQSDFREGVLSKEYFRRKTGQIVSSIVAEAKGLHAEFGRQYSARSRWHFRQPSLVLLYCRVKVKRVHLDIDGLGHDLSYSDYWRCAVVADDIDQFLPPP